MSTQGIDTTQLSLISSIHANQKKEAYIYNPSMLAITKKKSLVTTSVYPIRQTSAPSPSSNLNCELKVSIEI